MSILFGIAAFWGLAGVVALYALCLDEPEKITRRRNRLACRRLRHYGRRLMNEYMRATSALSMPISHAEELCPSLKRYRRRAKACVRMIRRLS